MFTLISKRKITSRLVSASDKILAYLWWACGVLGVKVVGLCCNLLDFNEKRRHATIFLQLLSPISLNRDRSASVTSTTYDYHSSSSFEPVVQIHCLAALDLGAGVG